MITHSKVSSKSDGADSTKVQPSDWNDDHAIADGYTFMQVATKTLNNDQIKALPTTPFELAPAPGANKIIVPISGVVRIDASAGGYQNGGAIEALGISTGQVLTFGIVRMIDLVASLNGVSTAPILLTAIDKHYVASDSEVTLGVVSEGDAKSSILYSSFSINQPLVLFIDNYDDTYSTNQGNYTEGHADNTLTVTVIYYVATI